MRLARSPIRTCIACRRRRPQAELVRYRRRPDGEVVVAVGSSRRHAATWGRGAYLCPSRECLSTATRRRAFERALGYAGAGKPRRIVRSPQPDVLWNETVTTVDEELRLVERTSGKGPDGDIVGGRRWPALVGLHDRLQQPGGSD